MLTSYPATEGKTEHVGMIKHMHLAKILRGWKGHGVTKTTSKTKAKRRLLYPYIPGFSYATDIQLLLSVA